MIYQFCTKQIPVLVNAYLVKRRTIWQIADPYHILIFILDGSCKIEFGTDIYYLNQGDICFIPANHSYTRYPLENRLCTMVYLHFTVDASPVFPKTEELQHFFRSSYALYPRENETNASIFFLKNQWENMNSQILDIACNTVDLFTKRQLFMCNAQLLYILSFLSHLVIQGLIVKKIDDDVSSIPAKLSSAFLFMEDHITETISLDELCSHCGISKSQLNRYFAEYTHTTVMDYFIHLRLSRAKQLFLTMPWLSVKEVAGQMGYDDPQYFSRIFHKYFHETPKEYRERVSSFKEESETESK